MRRQDLPIRRHPPTWTILAQTPRTLTGPKLRTGRYGEVGCRTGTFRPVPVRRAPALAQCADGTHVPTAHIPQSVVPLDDSGGHALSHFSDLPFVC